MARFEPVPFSDIEQSFMGVILERVAAAIAVAHRFQEAESRSMELALLYEMAELMVSTVQLDPLLGRLTRRMVESFDLSFSAIRLPDPQTGLLPIRAYYHRDPDEGQRLAFSLIKRAVPEGERLAGRTYAHGEPYAIKDIQEDALIDPEVKAALGPGSLIAVPLRVRERVLGVLIWFVRAGKSRSTRPCSAARHPARAFGLGLDCQRPVVPEPRTHGG